MRRIEGMAKEVGEKREVIFETTRKATPLLG
jgi:hypothetical protein